uniref:Uncharacterized protein n=1 Tax=viral metagenome TaxID=1070528 RepID=A0A6C0JVC4_9ZZZZ
MSTERLVTVCLPASSTPRFTIKCSGNKETTIEDFIFVPYDQTTYWKEGSGIGHFLAEESEYIVYTIDISPYLQDHWKVVYVDRLPETDPSSISALISPDFAGRRLINCRGDSDPFFTKRMKTEDYPNLNTLYYHREDECVPSLKPHLFTNSTSLGITRFKFDRLCEYHLNYLSEVERIDSIQFSLPVSIQCEGIHPLRVKTRKLTVRSAYVKEVAKIIDFSTLETLVIGDPGSLDDRSIDLIKDVPDLRVYYSTYEKLAEMGKEGNVSTVFASTFALSHGDIGDKTVVSRAYFRSREQHIRSLANTTGIERIDHIKYSMDHINKRLKGEHHPSVELWGIDSERLKTISCEFPTPCTDVEGVSSIVKFKVYVKGDCKPGPKSARK